MLSARIYFRAWGFRFVADELKIGRSVEPQLFESVTVYFSDLEDFVFLTSQSSPMQIVNLLNDVYNLFDDTVMHYDVYKVGPIRDSKCSIFRFMRYHILNEFNM